MCKKWQKYTKKAEFVKFFIKWVSDAEGGESRCGATERSAEPAAARPAPPAGNSQKKYTRREENLVYIKIRSFYMKR